VNPGSRRLLPELRAAAWLGTYLTRSRLFCTPQSLPKSQSRSQSRSRIIYLDSRRCMDALTPGLRLYRLALAPLPACACASTGLRLYQLAPLPACASTGLRLYRLAPLPACASTGLRLYRLAPLPACASTGLRLYGLAPLPACASTGLRLCISRNIYVQYVHTCAHDRPREEAHGCARA
jgi:hypothetical protein